MTVGLNVDVAGHRLTLVRHEPTLEAVLVAAAEDKLRILQSKIDQQDFGGKSASIIRFRDFAKAVSLGRTPAERQSDYYWMVEDTSDVAALSNHHLAQGKLYLNFSYVVPIWRGRKIGFVTRERIVEEYVKKGIRQVVVDPRTDPAKRILVKLKVRFPQVRFKGS